MNACTDIGARPPVAPLRHVISGATGFVGAALLLELLEHTADNFLCIVRAADDAAARARIHALLQEVGRMYECAPQALAQIATRVDARAGDVNLPLCGLDAANLPAADVFWHAAASLKYEDRYAREIMQTNVSGTRHMLDLAQALGVRECNTISTCYVSGTTCGPIGESYAGQLEANNLYEKSKMEMEALLHAPLPFAVRIFRPSIVIGHSRTLAAMNFSGMYGFMRQLHAFHRLMQRTQPGLLEREPLRLRVSAGLRLDLVAVDQVAQRIRRLWQATDVRGAQAAQIGQPLCFHINNPTPPLLDDVIRIVFETCRMPPPLMLRSAAQHQEMQWLDEKFNSRISFYRAQFYQDKRFLRNRSEALIGPDEAAPHVLDDAKLRAYCAWYLQVLEAELAAQNRPAQR
ncbi:SDR family oxidoreductase [Massilia sp. W12]|uniref:SDR family oxidoreductase n=1 Tax=Massilia sp. W12 TaxID=3126507 RepID=UPI0030D2FBC5